MVNPRICTLPVSKSKDLGKRAVDLSLEAGLELDEWQEFVLVESMAEAKKGEWAAREVGVNCARQNGKNAILEARELAEIDIIRSNLVIHSAHQFDTSLEHFLRLQYLIEETPRLRNQLKGGSKGIKRSHGEEGFEFTGNRRIRFRTRTKGGGRGFSSDLLVLDEAMFLPEMTMGALFPTKRARPNPQVWYTGSAVDQQIHENGVAFTRLRERGMKEGAKLAYFEWSVEGDDPSFVPLSVLRDRAAWKQANPALGIRIDPETMAEELESLDPRTFAVELLGIGDWPRTDHVASVIDLETWERLADEKRPTESLAFAFDVSPDRQASISVAGKNGSLWYVELVESRRGTSWLPDRALELQKKYKAKFVCDGYGPAASLVSEMEEKGVDVEPLSTAEHSQACGQFVDAVEEGTLRYYPADDLMSAVRAARTRPLGDAWAWSRKNSAANISPLVSATLALAAAKTIRPKKVAYAWA